MILISYFIVVYTILLCIHESAALAMSKMKVSMHFEEALLGNTKLTSQNLQRQRYIATNRFNVRKNKMQQFEKRWADRKSRLSLLEGFRFFTLLKRIDNEDDQGNYISLTVWENKDNFDEWRTGDSFKEAHGSGSIGDFMKLLSTALFILKGGPKPAFYDGLLPISPKNNNILTKYTSDSGWKSIPADGINFLPSDVFVIHHRYKIEDNNIESFEKSVASQKQNYDVSDNFIGSFVMRRDASKADDGYNYIEMSVWTDKNSYENWKQSNVESLVTSLPVGAESTAYYEGKLALSSSNGI